jgi:hypothetical protein
MSRLSARLATLAALVLVAVPSAAMAQDHHGPDHNQIVGVRGDIHGSLDRWGVIGVGARADIPLVSDGFIQGNVHDELALSLGADLLLSPVDPYYYGGGAYLIPIAALQWNFYLGDRWSIFPELGLAFHIGFDDYSWNGHGSLYAEPDLGFGARYHFSARNALLLRLSSPGGFQVGITF